MNFSFEHPLHALQYCTVAVNTFLWLLSFFDKMESALVKPITCYITFIYCHYVPLLNFNMMIIRLNKTTRKTMTAMRINLIILSVFKT
jgi:hypothetical protein